MLYPNPQKQDRKTRHNKSSREWAARNREKVKAYRERYKTLYPERYKEYRRKTRLKTKFGLTVEQYDNLLVTQGGVCAICDGVCANGDKLAVDHNHVTGAVRGLLCHMCNTALGRFGDNPSTLRKAIAYLEKYGE